MKCPRYQSQAIVKNGSINSGKQKYACKDRGRQFVENPQNTNQPIPQMMVELIDN
ncbi:IS1 family transposase [Thioflexothrix psekupsii]|uniref:IS1 family transposase n=1 Tax=Thioflexithrix psekupsensis TaxID=1570016 RepID=UPI001124635C